MPGASSWSLFLTTAGSQRECLVVNALAGNPEVLGDGDQFRDESLRTADEYVAPVQVGNEPRQRALVERYPLAAADQLMQLAAAVPDQFPHLLAEHKIFFSGGPQYDDRSAGPRQVFQQRSQCRDADPGCHQQSFRPLLRVPRECPAWSLDGNRCTRPQPRQRSGVITSTFEVSLRSAVLGTAASGFGGPSPPMSLVSTRQKKNWRPAPPSRSRWRPPTIT